MNKILKAFAIICSACLLAACTQENSKTEPVDYVNTYIGNISHLLVPVYPTVSLPHSMLRVFPMRRQVTDEYVNGLPLLVTGHRAEAGLSIGFPGLKLNWDNEHVTPYSYETELAESTIHSTFSASHQAAIYDLQFRGEGPFSLTVNAEGGEMSAEGNTVKGFQYCGGQTRAYIYVEFETAPKAAENIDKSHVALSFDTSELRIRYGVSFISTEQAAKNLAREIKDYDVNALIAQGRKIWNDALGRLEVSGGSEDDLTVFYTSYYRTLERPVCISEDGRYWSGEDNQVHEDGGVPYYTDDWLWDTYHSAHPLRTIVDPALEESILASYLRMSDENSHGWLPCFPGVGGAGRAMNCCHTIGSLADAVCKGLDVDVQKAAAAAANSLRTRTVVPWSNAPAGQLDEFYWKNGYLPALLEGEKETDPNVHEFEKRQPIPVTTGTSFDCWAASRLLRVAFDKTGNKDCLDESEYFFKHSFDYRNLFNRKTGFFHPKDSKGRFIEPFDYNFPGGMGAREYYDENNAWVYRWDVQHNVYDLVSLMGGEQKFVAQLDSMFAEPLGMDKYDFYAKLPDHTGNVGQFSMGNEPSLHVPYLYNFAGAPWKTQKRVRQMLDNWFRNDYMGMPGDEDGGGLTSFVVFSSLGFFPVCPGKPEYSIGSPLFEDAKIHLPDGKTFEVKANNVSKDNKYIQSATLNGKPWNEPTISHADIVAGGVLELEMGPLPNKEWGVKSSISYDSYKGLAMAGYQGWFFSPEGGSEYAWAYSSADGVYYVDMLPDVLEYPQTYPIPGRMADGSHPRVYSAYDYSSVDVHFRWMKEYGLDGVFMQRFIGNITNSRRDHYLHVMDNAMSCAERYDRAICIMYDLSGGEDGTMADVLLDDIDELNVRYNLFDHGARPSYLWHNGKPLVVVWGIGFMDRAEYYLDEAARIIDGLKERGYSIMLGVPTYWREQGEDTRKDPRLYDYISKADIIMPWYVGRSDNDTLEDFLKIVPEDVKWCKEHGIGFAGDVWPGFSWENMCPGADDAVPRRGGEFLQRQIDACIEAGCESLYISMFDEVNEGTAIFKIAREVPVPAYRQVIVPLEDGVPSDRYLTICGEAARRLKEQK
ncbi:MAG: GH92 family glycosyl hydrolase [Bacteroidales bacterium]|nr:GH92 family glycosyl hydrolase [Candidatus Cryptobacteroides choladohippi]